MTGYGEAAGQGKKAKVTVQLRTLNHRHLDIQLRTPREYLSLEEEIRKIVRQKLARGRVDLFITRYPLKDQGRKLELDESLLGQYLRFLRKAKKKFALKGEVDISLCSTLPELFHMREAEPMADDEEGVVLKALDLALRKLEQSREREGWHLRLDVQSQIRHLRRMSERLDKEAVKNSARIKGSLYSREAGNSVEHQKEASEASGLSLKGDINEEIVRLKSHVAELTRLIHEKEPVGKRIDFLLQEIQRELNTVSSKVPYLTVVQLVLEGKERVEKIREQTQNIE